MIVIEEIQSKFRPRAYDTSTFLLLAKGVGCGRTDGEVRPPALPSLLGEAEGEAKASTLSRVCGKVESSTRNGLREAALEEPQLEGRMPGGAVTCAGRI